MSLSVLPTELINHVASFLSFTDIENLRETARKFESALGPLLGHLYRRSSKIKTASGDAPAISYDMEVVSLVRRGALTVSQICDFRIIHLSASIPSSHFLQVLNCLKSRPREELKRKLLQAELESYSLEMRSHARGAEPSTMLVEFLPTLRQLRALVVCMEDPLGKSSVGFLNKIATVFGIDKELNLENVADKCKNEVHKADAALLHIRSYVDEHEEQSFLEQIVQQGLKAVLVNFCEKQMFHSIHFEEKTSALAPIDGRNPNNQKERKMMKEIRSVLKAKKLLKSSAGVVIIRC